MVRAERLLDEIVTPRRRERGYALREPFHPWPDRDWQAVRQDGRRSMAVPVMLRRKPGRVAQRHLAASAAATRTRSCSRHLNALKRTAEMRSRPNLIGETRPV